MTRCVALATLCLALLAGRGDLARGEGLPALPPAPSSPPRSVASTTDAPAAADTPASEGVGSQAAEGEDDPLEPFNRSMFVFNEKLDEYLMKPAATAWDFVLPRAVERGVGNFFENLRFPIRFVNKLLQGELDPAAIVLCRFVVNTTVGLAGFVDFATTLGLPPQRADFGQTLGRWGVPAGPYIVWPILGSSNPRDTVGLLADSYIGIQSLFIDFYILIGAVAIDTVNARALVLEEVAGAREASLDFYVAVRHAYWQRRRAMIAAESEPLPAREQELYFPDYSDDGIIP